MPGGPRAKRILRGSGSPPQEAIQGDTWWTRYQPVSYKLESRSGSRSDFESMVSSCNEAGVNVVVDLVINHMSSNQDLGGDANGTVGSGYNGNLQSYDGVPYSRSDFHHPYCEVSDLGDPDEVRDCYLLGLNDLDQGHQRVRDKINGYANDLIDLGVKGFRVDAAKHMRTEDLEAMQVREMISLCFFYL